MEDLKRIIAKNIVELRRSSEMTQIELAEKLNYSDKAVSKWERGESIPDISVLKSIADIFSVSIDYLTEEVHINKNDIKIKRNKRKIKNHGFATGIAILIVWLVATLVFVVLESVPLDTYLHYLAYVYAVPVSFIVWLIFNSIWFNKRRNFWIITLLVWTALLAVCTHFAMCYINIWITMLLGIPAQAIIVMWSRIKRNKN